MGSSARRLSCLRKDTARTAKSRSRAVCRASLVAAVTALSAIPVAVPCFLAGARTPPTDKSPPMLGAARWNDVWARRVSIAREAQVRKRRRVKSDSMALEGSSVRNKAPEKGNGFFGEASAMQGRTWEEIVEEGKRVDEVALESGDFMNTMFGKAATNVFFLFVGLFLIVEIYLNSPFFERKAPLANPFAEPEFQATVGPENPRAPEVVAREEDPAGARTESGRMYNDSDEQKQKIYDQMMERREIERQARLLFEEDKRRGLVKK